MAPPGYVYISVPKSTIERIKELIEKEPLMRDNNPSKACNRYIEDGLRADEIRIYNLKSLTK